MLNAATNHSVKQNNRFNTLRAILNHGRISQPELAKLLSHSGPTVLQNVKELSAAGLVREDGELVSTGGRKAKAFVPIAQAQYALGIDITKNHIRVIIIDLVNSIQLTQRHSFHFTPTDDYFQSLGQFVNNAINESQIPRDRLSGIGISLPGIIDHVGQKIISSHVLKLWNFSTTNFSRYLNYPCFFINDANAAGLAEMHRHENLEHLIYLSLSNSVGGALLHGDHLFMGEHLRAGEFGHMTLVPDGQECYCGKQGCLDAYCNAQLLSRMTDDKLEIFFQKLPTDETLQAKWQEYLNYLAVAVNNLHMIFDCNVMVGGYVGCFLEQYAPTFREILAKRNTFEQDCAYFRYCTYQAEAAAVGAALLPLKNFIQEFCFN